MQLNCDLFVFSDKDPRNSSWTRIRQDFEKHHHPIELLDQSESHVVFRSEDKTGILFWEDNNRTLRRIHEAGLKVHHFVGICDGCSEGGNHECVHERPFVSRLLQVGAKDMKYTTDHSKPLEQRPYGWGSGVPSQPKFRSHLFWNQFPEPSHHQMGAGPDEHESVFGNPVFNLQGVLVAPDHQGYGKVRRKDLTIKCFDSSPTELEALIPFRTLGHRGILAEYRLDRILTEADVCRTVLEDSSMYLEIA